MNFSDEDIRRCLELGEDSKFEFKQIEFNGDIPKNPSRDCLADEIIGFANADGGFLFCGVTDDGRIQGQGMSPKKLSNVSRLLAEISSCSIKPSLNVSIYHREFDGKGFVLVEVPKGDSVHERNGKSFIRVGPRIRRMNAEEALRLAQNRVHDRYLWCDNQTVSNTGFQSLNERFWEPLLSSAGAKNPRQCLRNLHLLAYDETGVERATNAGVLICATSPQQWIPHATIMATHYRGKDRASGQMDARELVGPLGEQIVDAVNFVNRNMRVPNQITSKKQNLTQYSITAVFEAIVNAVVHRDYSITSSRIRVSMFQDRIEIDSPGQLPNGMTIDDMVENQMARNQVIASVFGLYPVQDILGLDYRRFIMERRGDGVANIIKETREISGSPPQYKLIGESNLLLTLPAARLEPSGESL